MTGELITVEYAGPSPLCVGTLPRHDVRAWWVIRDDGTEGRVKLAAGRELKRHVAADHVEFVCWDMSTYNTPHLNAMLTFQVLTREQMAERKRRAALTVLACGLCGSAAPCNYIRTSGGREMGVCFGCLHSRMDGMEYRTIAWIKANGKLQV